MTTHEPQRVSNPLLLPGSREQPFELSDSDEDVSSPAALTSVLHDPHVKAKARPARRKTYLGVIELTDSEPEEEENKKPLISSPQSASTLGKRGLAVQGRTSVVSRSATSSRADPRKQRRVSDPSGVKNEGPVDWIDHSKRFRLDNLTFSQTEAKAEEVCGEPMPSLPLVCPGISTYM
ncbi:hypothetical protein GY45DRAFT_302687 [Cubamyces sp. BRFM 1775]|nr:hypothetical protein GY45DRAFT_302687 [Cubamyces sp. BRFM 1775]